MSPIKVRRLGLLVVEQLHQSRGFQRPERVDPQGFRLPRRHSHSLYQANRAMA